MLNHVVCECASLMDTLVYCAPVRMAEGDLEAIYIGPSGVFVIAATNTDLASVYFRLRDYLGTSMVEVFHAEKGRYNAAGAFTNDILSTQELDAVIYRHTTQGPTIWDLDALAAMQKKIRILDGINRGIYRDDDGVWYLARGKQFYPCSDLDADRVFLLGLLGGVLGIHRFAVGKWFTGIIYLLTGGLMGCGWVLDVLQMVSGGFKDKKKRLLAKPIRLSPAWYISGLFCGIVLLGTCNFALSLLVDMLGQAMYSSREYVDEETVLWLISLKNMLRL